MSQKFLLIASYPQSIINFRGSLLVKILELGFELHLAIPKSSSNDSLIKQFRSLNIQIHEIKLDRTGMNPFIDIVTILSLWLLIRRVKPSFSLAYTVKPVIYGCLASFLGGIGNNYALITGLGYVFTNNSNHITLLEKILTILYRISLYRVSKVFFHNKDDEELFFSKGIINKFDNKTCVVNGSGVSIDTFKIASFPKVFKFLMIARLLGNKGIREFVQAAKIVRKHNPQVKFGVVGWIDDNPDSISKNELLEWENAGDVQFHGQLHDVKLEIAKCSVYVLPSYREGTPRSVLEAMAMGRPIITTDTPGCRETVKDNWNGFLVPVKSAEKLSIAMLKFIESPNLVTTMGKRSRKIAEDKYDVNKVDEVMLKEMKIC